MAKSNTSIDVDEAESNEVYRQADLDTRPKRQPRYHVILWDDDDHSYAYVQRMMCELFGHHEQRAYEIAKRVDSDGRAVCLTTTLEHAELKRDQIHAYGRDDLIARCRGAMSASLEPDR